MQTEAQREYRKRYQKTEKFKTRIRAYAKARRANPEINARITVYMARYKDKHRIAVLTRLAINRARKGNIPYDAEHLRTFHGMRPTNCPSCRKEFIYAAGWRSHRPHPQSPSLDRIDPARGYVAGNVAIICWRCNAIKRDGTLEELTSILNYVRAHLCKA